VPQDSGSASIEKVQKRRFETAVGHDSESARRRVPELDVPHVGAGEFDGGGQGLLQQRRHVTLLGKPRADLMQPGHGGQVGRKAILEGGQFAGPLGDTLLQRLVDFLQRRFRPLPFRNVNPHLHDKRRAIGVGERKVVDVVAASVRAGPLPAMGRVSLQGLKTLAVLARLGALEQILVAALAVRLAEAFFEEAIGKGHVMIRRQEQHVSRQHVQHVMQSLPFRLDGGMSLGQFGGPLGDFPLQALMRLVQS